MNNPIIKDCIRFFDRIKATYNFWLNYGKEIESKELPEEIPDYVEDWDNIEQNGSLLENKDISEIHPVKQTCTFSINFPAHLPRKDSNLFIQTRKHLIDELDTPCWVCGSKENRQLHHSLVEFNMQNAVDWDKVKILCPQFDWTKVDKNNPDTFVNFIDSEHNANLVLCQPHHTSTGKDGKYGIHYLPYPAFLMQYMVKSDFKLFND